jgi:hypothetical protein
MWLHQQCFKLCRPPLFSANRSTIFFFRLIVEFVVRFTIEIDTAFQARMYAAAHACAALG